TRQSVSNLGGSAVVCSSSRAPHSGRPRASPEPLPSRSPDHAPGLPGPRSGRLFEASRMRLSVAPYSLTRALSVDGCSLHTPTHRRRILFFHTPTHEIANVSFSVYSDKTSIEI